ncbi:MAG: hypothetical protein ACM3VW_07680 [Bacteroidota bacterium]
MQVGLCLAGGTQELSRVDLGLVADLGFSCLFMGCYEDDMHWRAEEVAGFTRRARARKLNVIAVPWGYGKVLDPDPAIPSLYVETHPQSLQVDSRGRRVPKACPNNPYFLEWFSSSMRTLAWMLEVNGFLWDEPSFHYARGTWACRCEYCLRLFHAQTGREMPREFTDLVVEFRESSVVMFLLAAAAAIQAVDYKLDSLVMPAPSMPGSQLHSGTSNWGALAGCSACDAISLFVPWQHNDVPMEQAVKDLQQEAARHAEKAGKRSLLWLAASPNPRDKVVDALTCAHHCGVEMVVLADYGTLIDATGFERSAPQLKSAIAAVR